MTIQEAELLDWKFEPIRFSVSAREAILYGLSLGIGANPTDPRQLCHVYEDGLVPYPTMSVVLGSPGIWFGKAGLDARKVLHGSQGLEVLGPVLVNGPLVAENRVTDLVDRGAEKGAVVEVTRTISTGEGTAVARLVSTYVCRGDGGFGGSKTVGERPLRRPEGDPDQVCRIATLPQAALLYRLNGDTNPLHADPAMARNVGFDRPILHGLCTFGHAARGLVALLCGDDATRLTAMSARMTRPVYPGEELEVSVWGGTGAHQFEVSVPKREVTVLAGGSVEMGPAA